MKARIGSALLIVFFGVTGTYLVLSSTHSSRNNLQAETPTVWPPEVSTSDRDNLSALPAETRPEPASNPTPDQPLAGTGIAMPDSLRGTDVDGGLRVDPAGNLIVDKSVKRLFDYFLGTVGEWSVADIRNNLQALVDQTLVEPARTQALDLLDNYLQLKKAIHEYEQQVGETDLLSLQPHQLASMGDRLQYLEDLRRSYLGDSAANAFYSDAEAVDRFTLTKLNVLNNPELSETEKRAIVAQAEADLPVGVKAVRAKNHLHEKLAEAEAELHSSGAGPQQIQSLREDVLGVESAKALAQVEHNQAAFRKKLAEYRRVKAQILDSPLGSIEQEQELHRIRESLFSGKDLSRVEAMERVAVANTRS